LEAQLPVDTQESDYLMSHNQVQVLPPGVSVVVPVYQSNRTLRHLVDRIEASLDGQNWELILVDDGSDAPTWTIVADLAASEKITGIRLSRNSGQHAALLAGIRQARFDVIVTLDDDLQNPPEEIPRLLGLLQSEDVDLVYGWSPSPAQDWWRRAGSSVLRRVILRLLGVSGAERIGPFRAFRTRLRDGFSGNMGPGVSLDALLSWTTSRLRWIEVGHAERHDGRSGYSLRTLSRFAFDVITGFSTAPLKWVTRLGFAAALFGLSVLVYVVGGYFVRGTTVAGFAFMTSLIALFSGAQMLSIGILGEYLGRTHVRVMGQPTYVVAEIRKDRDRV
jgi:glycosyltransferase involved in cell wall biosynthesis